jgi:hypothetical protein
MTRPPVRGEPHQPAGATWGFLSHVAAPKRARRPRPTRPRVGRLKRDVQAARYAEGNKLRPELRSKRTVAQRNLAHSQRVCNCSGESGFLFSEIAARGAWLEIGKCRHRRTALLDTISIKRPSRQDLQKVSPASIPRCRLRVEARCGPPRVAIRNWCEHR